MRRERVSPEVLVFSEAQNLPCWCSASWAPDRRHLRRCYHRAPPGLEKLLSFSPPEKEKGEKSFRPLLQGEDNHGLGACLAGARRPSTNRSSSFPGILRPFFLPSFLPSSLWASVTASLVRSYSPTRARALSPTAAALRCSPLALRVSLATLFRDEPSLRLPCA